MRQSLYVMDTTGLKGSKMAAILNDIEVADWKCKKDILCLYRQDFLQ